MAWVGNPREVNVSKRNTEDRAACALAVHVASLRNGGPSRTSFIGFGFLVTAWIAKSVVKRALFQENMYRNLHHRNSAQTTGKIAAVTPIFIFA